MGTVSGLVPWTATPSTPTCMSARNASRSALVIVSSPMSGHRLQEVRRGVLRRDLVPGLRDLSLLVDEERGAQDAHVLAAVHRLLGPHVERLGHRVVLIREQREAERVLVVELLLLRGLVGADPEDDGVAHLRQH